MMVCLDGYTLTHTYEPVELLDQELVDDFLPRYEPVDFLTVYDPKSFGMFADPNYYTEFRYQNQKALENAKTVISDVSNAFGETFGRNYGGLIETYRCDDAEHVIMAIGSVVGTVKDTIDDLREEGRRVGAIKVRALRPFPSEEIRKVLEGVQSVGVIDKNVSLGFAGALFCEVKACLYNNGSMPDVYGFIAGLGGRDIPKRAVKKMAERIRSGSPSVKSEFADLRSDILEEV
jgi:pyruvate ferredoxin oxidoreductase alpha subunit